jgi:LysR family transcriptional regulator, low CO2-responsive transcriptional regulator
MAKALLASGLYRHAAAFSIKDLQILVHLANGCTQLEVAERLSLEQPAISKHLRTAEQRSGIPLVAHDGRRLSLTQAGREVAALATEILAKYDALEQMCAASQSGEAQPVRLLASGTPGSYVLPDVIASYLQQFPGKRVETDVRFRGGALDMFAGGSYDLAVVTHAQPTADLLVETLYIDRFVLFVTPGHPLLKKRARLAGALPGVKLITKSIAGEWPRVFEGLEKLGFARENTVEFLSYEGVKHMVSRNLGVGMLFETAVRDELGSGVFVPLPIEADFLDYPFSLVRRSTVPLTPPARRFRTFLLEHFAPQQAAPK